MILLVDSSKICLIPVLSLLVFACSFTPSKPDVSIYDQVHLHGWERQVLQTELFDIVTFLPGARSEEISNDKSVTIFIEGDGMAWVNSHQVSMDPTPRNPLGLKLALEHPDSKVAYLARPCQFVESKLSKGCNSRYWTSHRFSEEVVAAMNEAVEQIKQIYHAKQLILVGYSGGGAVAALVAAMRTDVVRLITVAGNLDHVYWAKMHKIRPLKGSLNPPDVWQSLVNIPQIHLVGENDFNIRVGVLCAYVSKFNGVSSDKMGIYMIPDMDHSCCWDKRWRSLWHDFVDDVRVKQRNSSKNVLCKWD